MLVMAKRMVPTPGCGNSRLDPFAHAVNDAAAQGAVEIVADTAWDVETGNIVDANATPKQDARA